jgi:hypothetical protein
VNEDNLKDEINRLNRIIKLLISANIDSRYHQPLFENSYKYPSLCFGMWNIILDDITEDTSLKDIDNMFRARIDKIMEERKGER